jgi:glycosyltransferase involved in cell wall biosynthesis
MKPWIEKVDEIVVVDSYSDDGTVELIRERLVHPRLTIHQRPRGLYQAWNYGIAQLQSKYTYISTVGDTISSYGIDHLLKVAEEHDVDVVVSRPDFITEEGAPMKGPKWPVNKINNILGITEPSVIDNMTCLLFQLLTIPDAILGSSASNLYKTHIMKTNPFPTEYGTVGDGAWGIANVFKYRLAVTPEKFTSFRHHEKSYSKDTYKVANLNNSLFKLMEKTVLDHAKESPKFRNKYETYHVREMLALVSTWFEKQITLEAKRDNWLPWILNPSAWYIRLTRDETRRKLHKLINSALQGESDKNIDLKDIKLTY